MSNSPLSDDPSLDAGAAAPATDPALDALQRERDELRDRLLRTRPPSSTTSASASNASGASMPSGPRPMCSATCWPCSTTSSARWRCPRRPRRSAYRDGVELIHRQLLELLKKRGVVGHSPPRVTTSIPAVHQAVAHDEVPGARDGEILNELRRGYRLGERLLRPAMVRVAKAS